MRHPSRLSSLFLRHATWRAGLFALAVFGSGCATPDPSEAAPRTRIWDSRAERYITHDTLIERLRQADVALLGEAHDNPVHHRVETWVLQALAASATMPALVMEQYDLEQQPAIDTAVAAMATTQHKLDDLRSIMVDGWDWTLYRPLLAVALQAAIPVRAANSSRATLQRVSRTGLASLGVGQAARLGLNGNWSARQQAALERDIVDGHCGLLPASAVPAVALAQRTRDAVMADQLLAALSAATTGAGPVLGIFGREHVRRDLAIPVYLDARAPATRVISVGMIEVAADSSAAAIDADIRAAAAGHMHDYLVLTPPAERHADPCAALGKPVAAPR